MKARAKIRKVERHSQRPQPQGTICGELQSSDRKGVGMRACKSQMGTRDKTS